MHGQFNNNLSVPFTPTKYLDHLPSLYDFDLFSLNLSLNRDIDPEQSAMSNHVRCRYFSPNSIYKENCNLGLDSLSKASFSIFHNNISSLRANIENLQTHILEELDFPFSIIGITECRIRNEDLRGFNYGIPCYSFEYVPTPLADYDYPVIEKTSEIAYQAPWIEVIFSQKKNINCCVAYRQHNNPECFSKYIDDNLESFSSKGNPVFLLSDTNIDLLQVNTCNYAHNFLLSLQSNSMLPTIDKPTRVHRESATLIDNIFTNSLDNLVLSGNIITDLHVSDHFSQLCVMNSTMSTNRVYNFKVLYYSQFSETSFINDVQQTDWTTLLPSSEDNPSKLFSSFFNKLNQLVNKPAPL